MHNTHPEEHTTVPLLDANSAVQTSPKQIVSLSLYTVTQASLAWKDPVVDAGRLVAAQTDRQTHRQIHRRTDRQRDTKTDRLTLQPSHVVDP